jgi:DNA polymerase-3 subunit gamma/tau
MLAFRPESSMPRVKSDEPAVRRDVPSVAKSNVANPKRTSTASQPVSGDEPNPADINNENRAGGAGDYWAVIVDALALSGMVKQLAAHCVLERRDEQVLHLRLDEAHAHLGRETMKQRLEQCLQKYFSSTMKLVLRVGQPQSETPAAIQQRLQQQRQEEAEEAIRNDGAVRALEEAFDARIVPETIQPHGS